MPIDFPNSPTTNQLFQSGDKTWRYDGEKWVIYATIVVVDSTPIGSIQAFAGTTAPTGWFLAFGQAISRATFADLFAVIGTTYGVGDGSTTFNLPDLRGRTIAGVDNMGGSAASRLTTGTSGITGTSLGATGGDERVHQHSHANTATFAGTAASHSHTQNAHRHGLNVARAQANAYLDTGAYWAGGTSLNNEGYANTVANNNATMYEQYLTQETPGINSTSVTPAGTVTMTNANAGSGSAQNVQPTMVLNYLIKYGPSNTINVVDDQLMLPAQIFS